MYESGSSDDVEIEAANNAPSDATRKPRERGTFNTEKMFKSLMSDGSGSGDVDGLTKQAEQSLRFSDSRGSTAGSTAGSTTGSTTGYTAGYTAGSTAGSTTGYTAGSTAKPKDKRPPLGVRKQVKFQRPQTAPSSVPRPQTAPSSVPRTKTAPSSMPRTKTFRRDLNKINKYMRRSGSNFGKVMGRYRRQIRRVSSKGVYFNTVFGVRRLRDNKRGLYLKAGGKKWYLHLFGKKKRD